MGLTDSAFVRACRGCNDGPIPVWIMRQAGRYLPEYRAVREKVSFQELCRSPELITEVVKHPIARFDLDAAILFSDILTMLEPMGMQIDFPEGGPVLANPIESPADVDRLRDIDVEKELSFVLAGIREIKRALPDKPLIGFIGSPFTLASYMVQGSGSKNFARAKRFLHEYPEASQKMFDLLADIAGRYLRAQIEAGADAVQVFESWGGVLSRRDYIDWSVKPINRIFGHVGDLQAPRILFVNNVAPYLDIVKEVDCEVIGVDYLIELAEAARALPGKSVQGNLDPSVLFGPADNVRAETKRILDSLDNHNRVIFNLGHGIEPETPIESVQAMVDTVRAYR
ncbi:uroporphyrinogen decarboxylase [candidate division GN15 bacterium]|nr:uroporphyrinogen decarboxylase [candidate division GN15 bacterium]